MLKTLTLNQFILFNNQEINFLNNFTVITGDSGSGKSMFIKSLKFVLGEKFDTDLNISVCAQFSIDKNKYDINQILEENGIDTDNGNLTIRRIQSAQGKSKIIVNDNLTTLKFLKRISNLLVEFHSQQDQLEAFNPENTINIIDNFIEDRTLLEEVFNFYKKIVEVDLKIRELENSKNYTSLDIDYLVDSSREIRDFNLLLGEEESLLERKRLFSEKAKIVKILSDIQRFLEGKDQFFSVVTSWQKEIQKYLVLNSIEKPLEAMYIAADDLSREISKKQDDLSFEGDLDQIEERLSKLKELLRKYRCTSDELNNKAIEFENEYRSFIDSNNTRDNLISERKKLLLSYQEKSLKLSSERERTISIIEKKIAKQISYLSLDTTQIKYEFDSNLDRLSAKGIDRARLMLKTNQGFDFQEISKIASGGELSRIMLALKVALAGISSKTIIFDEIDAGTGGAVAETIGTRLKDLAQYNQIISISHQPQVASKASQHLLVYKKTDQVTESTIVDLTIEQRIEEVAKMISGSSLQDEALKIAKNLISSSF